MQIWAAPYTLRSRTRLSAKASAQERRGALVRVETSEGVGHADVHPWPELGDESLEMQVSALAEGRMTSLTKRSLALAQLDCGFRGRGVSAFDHLTVPPSHFLINDLSLYSIDELLRLRERGFTHLKIKIAGGEISSLVQLRPGLEPFRLRLDFNCLPTADEAIAFLQQLPQELAPEFVEDPAPGGEWARIHAATGVALALDREPGDAFQWVILKPAVQEPELVVARAKEASAALCVTSYLDHPLGQMGAAYFAASLSVGVSGLVSHLSYLENEWTPQVKKASLVPAEGTGFGYDDLLERENWKRIR